MTKKTKLLSLIPPEFDVGWSKFSFVIKKNLKDDDDSKCFGITDFNKFIISLDEGMSDKEAHHTIIHECCHALVDALGLEGPEEGVADKIETTNEIFTETTCRSFLMFKNLNPHLWDILFVDYYKRIE